MEVRITPTPEQEAFIRQAIASGRFKTAEDAARAALLRWEEGERRRAELLIELDAADTSLAQGKGRRLTSHSLRKLTEDVKQRGRSRLKLSR
jgi:Arc/MetJ-type ribon-helix-helix transcriptional regulator